MEYNLLYQLPPYLNSDGRYYYDEKEKLASKRDALGLRAYSDEQINNLIFRKFSKRTVSAVIEYHDQLVDAGLAPYLIYKIALNKSGRKNLKMFLKITQQLSDQGLTWYGLYVHMEDIARILARHGGSKNLDAFITSQLTDQKQFWDSHGVHARDLIRILSYDGGVKSLKVLMTATQDLNKINLTWQSLGIKFEYLIQLIAQRSGHIEFRKKFENILSILPTHNTINVTEVSTHSLFNPLCKNNKRSQDLVGDDHCPPASVPRYA
jgi:hypothetical protein